MIMADPNMEKKDEILGIKKSADTMMDEEFVLLLFSDICLINLSLLLACY